MNDPLQFLRLHYLDITLHYITWSINVLHFFLSVLFSIPFCFLYSINYYPISFYSQSVYIRVQLNIIFVRSGRTNGFDFELMDDLTRNTMWCDRLIFFPSFVLIFSDSHFVMKVHNVRNCFALNAFVLMKFWMDFMYKPCKLFIF
jgi:hypothetical protein